jgi:hypothetical protein
MGSIKSVDPTKRPDPTNLRATRWELFVAGLMCERCRRYRHGLAIVVGLALLLWLTGRWS